MTGKAYSIKEMKTIVDYLVEHKAYGGIKGRKMWIEFASSQLTSRTWQSLKETFLKRIMPDIHNPYYKLTIEQINSFRQGYDIADRNKNKLDIQTLSEDSTSSSCNVEIQKQPETGNAKEDEVPTGEDVICSKIPMQSRSSAETVILDNCYETTEDIQRDLESPVQDMKQEQMNIAARSLRDCITYSEPLTPMVQVLLDDFASEPEDEPRMVIVESTVTDTDNSDKPNQETKTSSECPKSENKIADVAKNAKGLSSCLVEEVLLSEIKEFGNQTSRNKHGKNPATEKKQPENTDKSIDKDKEDCAENNIEVISGDVTTVEKVNEVVNIVTDDLNIKDTSSIDKTNKSTTEKGSQNCSNSTPDSLLPNNPECLGNRTSIEVETQSKDNVSIIELSEDVDKTNATRKRTASQDTVNGSKKKKLIDETKTTEIEKISTDVETKIDKDTAKNKVVDSKKSTEKQQIKTKLDIIEKPSTSKAIKSILAVPKAAEVENPCLKNLSLFDEQLSNKKYDTSETSEVEEPTKLPTVEKQDKNEKDDIVILKSHSDSDSHEKETRKERSKLHGVTKKQREKALANVFGFSSGPAKSHRKRRSSHHKKNTSHNITQNQHESGSSGWTSGTNSEMYVSPPRARKNRPTKKYLKPSSARIMSMEEEGGLFVMYGKKIFPLVKDGKIIKNYLTYSPSDSDEEDESYWKLKYVEEKKKSEELKKLLQRAKEPRPRDSKSPILQPNASRASKTPVNANQQYRTNGDGNELCIPEQVQKQVVTANTSQEKIKIRFTKKDEEVHLEGHWPQIHPVLAQVVHIFHQESDATVHDKSKMIVEHPESKTSSRCTTPAIIAAIDPEVHERVNEIEKEIFKEIEERDKEEDSTQNKEENNVTKRKVGRPRKSSSSSLSPSKRPRRSAKKITEETPKPVVEAENKVASVETVNRVSTRRSNNLPSRKVLNETANTNETKPIQKKGPKNQSEKSVESVEGAIDEDDDVRYMLPPITKRPTRSASNTRSKEQRQSKSTTIDAKISPPSNFSVNSLDSTQGYQDSDISPAKNESRKKKLINRSTYALRNRNEYNRNVRRRSHPYLCCDASNDSTKLSGRAPLKITQDSSLNPEVYKSESYQLLMPQVRRSIRSLERIDEAAPIESNNQLTAGHINSDVASSSNISLPLSPELSIVENLSISKDTLNYNQNYPTLNETQCNEMIDVQNCNSNKYIISGVDVTMPLMQQDCGIESCNADTLENSLTEPTTVVTESLLNKISTVNLYDQTPMTETLNQKLRNLLLESAKKVAVENIQSKEDMMDVDDDTEMRTKAGNKKRCSTPRKRKGTKKATALKIPRLVKEHVESCSFGGRKSCPPVVQDFVFDENALDEEIANLTVNSDANEKRKGRLKKDVIKVKIVRPKSKITKDKTSKNASKLSVYTDSGINDSGSGVFVPVNDSVDLIHNHSETCLHANECCGESVQFIENAKSAITIDSSSAPSNEWQSQMEYNDLEINLPECFCSNAQDGKSFYNEAKPSHIEDVNDTVYLSPAGTGLSYNSLITEDLSDDAEPPDRPSKWYLLSEEETINTNMAATNTSSFGANLKQIFPITYAVPNLSTISERSKDNDARKATLDTDAADTMEDLF